jgi:hypothetical protein
MPRTDVDALTITLSGDGTATLSGINYDDLRALLTAASLYRHDHPAEAKPLDGMLDDVQHDNNLETFLWHRNQGLILDMLAARMSKAISPAYGSGDTENIKALHAHYITGLEATVRKAEAEAAAAPVEAPDPIMEAANAIAKASRQIDTALATLRHAKRA